MKYNLITILFLFFFFQSLSGQINVEIPVAVDCGNTNNPIGLLGASQSTTQGDNFAERAIDGEINGTFSEDKASKTYVEANPYFQVDLENQSVLSELSIHYPSDLFPKGMGNYYILISDYPFENSNLSTNISSPIVESIYVDEPISSGTAIPLNNKSGKFVRIQLDGSGFISFTEVELAGIEPGVGSGEICGNGEDDDCDGRIDCEDNDCAPVITHVTKVEPTCPTCQDGQIRVNAANKRQSEVLYSLDGGSSFLEFNRAEEYSPDHLFDNLGEGTYDLVVKNDICEVVYQNNSITLSATTGILTSDCGNGDLEIGDIGWMFERYSVDGGDALEPNEAVILRTLGFFDPFVPEINGTWSALGEYILKLGEPGRNGNPNLRDDDQNIANFCFIVNEENQDFSFLYAPVLDDNHSIGNRKPFFRYEIFINGEEIDDFERTIRSDSDFFDEGPDDIRYKAWTCAFFDLSEHVGSEACVKFTVRDCTRGDHAGYVYIDGLCTDANLINPEIEILADEVFCADESVSLDVIGGGYSSYQWKVGKVNGNNNQYDIFEFPLQEPGYDASFSNVLFQYFTASGFSDDCSLYFAEVSVFGDCGTTTESIQFRRSCIDYVVDYCDYLLACTTNHDEFTFQGEIDCEGCTFDWQPAYYFVDNTVALPTVRADEISGTNDAFDRAYSLTYTAPDGCEDTRTVTVGNGIDVEINETYDLCYSTYLLTVNFDFDVVPEVIENLYAIDPENNFYHEFQGEYVSSTNRSITYKIEIDRSILYGVRPNTRAYYYIDFDFSVLDDVCLLDENETLCWKEGWLEEYTTNVFSKPWTINFPDFLDPFNLQVPNDPEVRTFKPYFGYLEDPNDCESLSYDGSSIYYAKLTITASNERIVWIKEATIEPGATKGLTGKELEWDGIMRCEDFLNFNCQSGYGCNQGDIPDDRCRDLSYPVGSNDDDPNAYEYHEYGEYRFDLVIASCTKELIPCDYLCENSDDLQEEEFCPDGVNDIREFNGTVLLYY